MVDQVFKEIPEGSSNKTKLRDFHKIMRKMFFAAADPFPLCGGITEGHNRGKPCSNRYCGVYKHAKILSGEIIPTSP